MADVHSRVSTRTCYLYRIASSHNQSEPALQKAALALTSAFHANSHVLQLLLAGGGSVEKNDDADSSPDVPGEAYLYADMALPAWRKPPGALEWLRGCLYS